MAFLIGIIILEISSYQKNEHKINILKNLINLDILKKYKKFTLKELKEFKKKNKNLKYAFYENFIIDLTQFSERHPGGNNLIESNLYSDIGRYITGTQSFSSDINSHDHKLETFKFIIEKLIIGILDENHNFIKTCINNVKNTLNDNESLESENKQFIHPSFDFFEENIFFFEKNNLAENTNQIVFDTENYKFSKFLPGIKWMGRNVSINSVKLNKTRYYSICLSLNPYMMNYLNLLMKRFISLERNQIPNEESLKSQLDSDNYTNFFYVYVKNYNFKNSLSRDINLMKKDEQILIRGPLVKKFFFKFLILFIFLLIFIFLKGNWVKS